MYRVLATTTILGLVLALVLSTFSQAWFAGQTQSILNDVKAGSLAIDMKTEPASDGKILLPGQHTAVDISLTNSGTIDSRWRIGVEPAVGVPDDLLANIIYQLYLVDDNDQPYQITAGRLTNFVIKESGADQWVYCGAVAKTAADNSLTIPTLSPDGVLPAERGNQPAGACKLQAVFKLSPAAQAVMQGRSFSGHIVVQAAQAGQDNWTAAELQ